MNWMVAVEILGFILLGVALVYAVKKVVKDKLGDAMIFGLVFVPVLLFGFFSGKVSELSGFGISAKALQAARSPVLQLSLSAEKFKIHNLTSNNPDFLNAAYFEVCADYFVVRPDQVPTQSYELDQYITWVTIAVKSSIACGRLAGLVVLDESDRYLGSYNWRFFIESASVWAVPNGSNPVSNADLSSRIKTMTIFGASLQYPKERITPGEGFEAALNVDASVSEAFEEFKEKDVEFLVLTDSLGRFKGILRYKDVVEEVLSAMLDQ